MLLFELSETNPAQEVPSTKPDHWRTHCSEILMQKASLINALIVV